MGKPFISMGHLYHGELLVITKLGNYYWVFRRSSAAKEHPEISRGLASGAQGAKMIGEVIDISSTFDRMDPSKKKGSYLYARAQWIDDLPIRAVLSSLC